MTWRERWGYFLTFLATVAFYVTMLYFIAKRG